MDRVIIVGAGVTGLSTAYHLAKQRFGEIILIDKGPVGDGSSRRAAGIITGLLWNVTGILVRKRCLELYRELSKELSGYEFQQIGCLNMFSAESWPEREKLLPLYDRLGAPDEIREEDTVDSLDLHLSQTSTPPGSASDLRRRMLPLLPALQMVYFESEKVGLATFSMDGEPVLGPVTALPGLLLGLAFHSGGFAYNPGTGELLAGYVSQGEPPKVYLEETIRQKDIAQRRH